MFRDEDWAEPDRVLRGDDDVDLDGDDDTAPPRRRPQKQGRQTEIKVKICALGWPVVKIRWKTGWDQ